MVTSSSSQTKRGTPMGLFLPGPWSCDHLMLVYSLIGLPVHVAVQPRASTLGESLCLSICSTFMKLCFQLLLYIMCHAARPRSDEMNSESSAHVHAHTHTHSILNTTSPTHQSCPSISTLLSQQHCATVLVNHPCDDVTLQYRLETPPKKISPIVF